MYRPNEQDSGISLTRVLIAVGLSIAFFAVYAYFVPQKPKTHASQAQNTQKTTESQAQTAPQTSQPTLENLQDSSSATESADSISPATTPQSLKQRIIAHIESDEFEIEIDALGRIKQVYLKDEKFTRHEQQSLFGMIGEVLGFKSQAKAERDKLPLFGDSQLHTMEVRFTDTELNKRAFETPYVASVSHFKLGNTPYELTLTQNLGDVVLKKILTIHPNLRYDVRVELNKPDLSLIHI